MQISNREWIIIIISINCYIFEKIWNITRSAIERCRFRSWSGRRQYLPKVKAVIRGRYFGWGYLFVGDGSSHLFSQSINQCLYQAIKRVTVIYAFSHSFIESIAHSNIINNWTEDKTIMNQFPWCWCFAISYCKAAI